MIFFVKFVMKKSHMKSIKNGMQINFYQERNSMEDRSMYEILFNLKNCAARIKSQIECLEFEFRDILLSIKDLQSHINVCKHTKCKDEDVKISNIRLVVNGKKPTTVKSKKK
jgi:hypothetical protein